MFVLKVKVSASAYSVKIEEASSYEGLYSLVERLSLYLSGRSSLHLSRGAVGGSLDAALRVSMMYCRKFIPS